MIRLALSSVIALLLLAGCAKESSEEAKKQASAKESATQTLQQNLQDEKQETKTETESGSSDTQTKSSSGEAAAAEMENTLKQAESAASENISNAATEASAAVSDRIEDKKEELKESVDIDGAKLYAKCAGCHGQKGEKKALGKSAPIGGLSKESLLESLKGYRAGDLNRYGMGALMKSQVSSFGDKELEKLAEYISSLK